MTAGEDDMSDAKDDDVEVRKEDQLKINEFGRLNGRLHDVEEDIKALSSAYDLLDDAANEIILADDDEKIQYMFGECFFELTKDQADEKLEAQKTEKEAEIDVLKGELKTIQGRLSDLKSSLYGRFGKNINLEE